ncbi:MAG: AAA family ATPase [Candidatus Micrarchaeota archaeon]
MRLVITGTPATGKTTLAKAIADKAGAELVKINEFVKRNGLGKKVQGGETEVEPAVLEKALNRELEGKRSYVVEGHLACECRLRADAVVVLRCDPAKLRLRYRKRGYAAAKAKDNLLAEALDYCLVRAETIYGRSMVLQLDATRKRTAEGVLAALAKWKPEKVDWAKDMLPGGRLSFLLREKGFKKGGGE